MTGIGSPSCLTKHPKLQPTSTLRWPLTASYLSGNPHTSPALSATPAFAASAGCCIPSTPSCTTHFCIVQYFTYSCPCGFFWIILLHDCCTPPPLRRGGVSCPLDHLPATRCIGDGPPAVLPSRTPGPPMPLPAAPHVCFLLCAHGTLNRHDCDCAHLPAPPGTPRAPGAAAFVAFLPPAEWQPGALHAGAPAPGRLTSHLCQSPGLAAAVWLRSLHPAAPAAQQANSANL